MFFRPKILFLVPLLFVALLNSIPTYLFEFFNFSINLVYIYIRYSWLHVYSLLFFCVDETDGSQEVSHYSTDSHGCSSSGSDDDIDDHNQQQHQQHQHQQQEQEQLSFTEGVLVAS